jgi:anti-sigma factor RsiW
MEQCTEIDSLTTPFVDDEAPAVDRERVDRHLGECAGCRGHVIAEQQAREIVRARGGALIDHAPPALRLRCAAASAMASPRLARRAMPLLSRTGWPMALAAAIVLAIAGVVFYGLVLHPSEAVAAQLTLDHLKCFALFEERSALAPADVQAALKARYGFDVLLPDGEHADGLALVGGRRCVYLEGLVAHLLYRRGGVPVSLFVLPPGANLSHTELEVLGHTAVAFTRAGRTWVVLARSPRADVERMATVFGRAAH